MPKLALHKVFHLPEFCDNAILRLWSIESAVNYRKLLFIARAINRSLEDNAHKLLLQRIRSFLKQPDDSIGLVKDLVAVFKTYDLYDLFCTGPQRTSVLTILNGNAL